MTSCGIEFKTWTVTKCFIYADIVLPDTSLNFVMVLANAAESEDGDVSPVEPFLINTSMLWNYCHSWKCGSQEKYSREKYVL